MNSVEGKRALGTIIIVMLLLAYMFYFSPQKTVPSEAAHQAQDSTASLAATAASKALRPPVAPPNSLLKQGYGVFAPLLQPQQGHRNLLTVDTEDLELHFSSQGGQLKALRLKKYLTHNQQPLWLVDSTQSYLSQAFFYQGRRILLSDLYFQSNAPFSELQVVGSDTLELRFWATLADGARLEHRYRVPAQGYHIDYQLQGLSPYASDGKLHLHWQHRIKPMEKDLSNLRQWTSLNYYLSNEGLKEIEVLGAGKKKEAQISGALEWISIKEKFFLLGLLPAHSSTAQLSLQDLPPSAPFLKEANLYVQLSARDLRVPTQYRMYLGPNDRRLLQNIHPTFAENVYLGWGMLGWINKTMFAPIFYRLLDFTKNYGLIILILVLFIRIILLPLTYRSYIGMAKMKVLKPEVDAIKEEHPGDLKKQQSETMRLYQLAGINPLSGCVPLLLQMPILFAMFYFFPNMIEFRQASFWWAEDLSSYDSILSLPFRIPMYGDHVSLFTLLMAASTLLFTLTNSQVSSAPQHMKTVQYIMPVILLVFLNSYSAGLTFYYFLSNLVAMGQQMLIKYFVNDEKIHARLQENKKKNVGKKKSSFQQRLEEAMKQQQQRKKKNK